MRDNSSDSETSDTSGSISEQCSDDDGNFFVYETVYEPYQNEPLAEGTNITDSDTIADEDGLPQETIEARYEGESSLSEWCKCTNCKVEGLAGARGFRCCCEIPPIQEKLKREEIDKPCIVMHPDIDFLLNETVLIQVGPLLYDKYGKGYRQKSNRSRNEYLQAVARGWILQWIFGSSGWDKMRPLPACVHDCIMSRFGDGES